jgi:soluble lytic murein transglycosylase
MKILRKFLTIIILLIILAIGVLYYYKNDILKYSHPKKYQEYVEKYSKKYEVEEEIVYATIRVESSFKADAVSSSNAKGLMQLLDSTAEELAKDEEIDEIDLFDAETNIMLGTKYIAKLMAKYENLELALAAYNAGIGSVDAWIESGIISKDGSDIENIPFKETNNYVRKVLRDYKIYKEIYE